MNQLQTIHIYLKNLTFNSGVSKNYITRPRTKIKIKVKSNISKKKFKKIVLKAKGIYKKR